MADRKQLAGAPVSSSLLSLLLALAAFPLVMDLFELSFCFLNSVVVCYFLMWKGFKRNNSSNVQNKGDILIKYLFFIKYFVLFKG